MAAKRSVLRDDGCLANASWRVLAAERASDLSLNENHARCILDVSNI